MRKIDSLKRDARNSATARGHQLSKFSSTDYWRISAFAICQNDGCSAGVTVCGYPLPNETNIAGDAVAVDCAHAGRVTWIQPESVAYTPYGSEIRRARVICPDGRVRIVRAGLPDTWFSIPAHVTIRGHYIAGYVTGTEDGLEFRVMDSSKEKFTLATGHIFEGR